MHCADNKRCQQPILSMYFFTHNQICSRNKSKKQDGQMILKNYLCIVNKRVARQRYFSRKVRGAGVNNVTAGQSDDAKKGVWLPPDDKRHAAQNRADVCAKTP